VEKNMKPVSHRAIAASNGGDLALPEIEHEAAPISIVPDGVMQTCNVPLPDILQFWESEHTRPTYKSSDDGTPPELIAAAENYLGECMRNPYLPVSEIRARQVARIKELVALAYEEIPVYRAKYQAAGFSPADLNEWDDIQKIPVITKPELIAAFPDQCVNARFNSDDLFPTRSSGSSGQTLLIRVNYDAILTDTIQGVRQFILQSGGKYRPEDLLTHVYTVPWWFDSIDGKYQTAFISNLIPPARVAQHLRYLGPKVLSLYPSNLEGLMPHADEFSSSLYLAVTHSEYSSGAARQEWSRRLGVPVLDEYSSEEATRIALELPCGHYHVCEDTVHLDVLDPRTMRPQTPGQSGLAVVTNLLNEAMPFIRYVQGDYVTQPANPEPCDVNWSQISTIDGRLNDAFINLEGRKVPAGSILDATYRWMFDCDLHLTQFEMVQRGFDQVEARFVLGGDTTSARVEGSISHLEDLLSLCLEHSVRVTAQALDAFPQKAGKRRPIRREMP
jgi:phenylacetate-CoA ligase